MSRPSILGILCCCLFASSTAVGWGQDYLELPEEPSGNGPTLTDRFLSLKDKFRREPKQTKQPTAKSSQRSKPRTPRYRKKAQPSSQQTQRTQRSKPSQLPQRSVPANRANGKQKHSKQARSKQARNKIVSRPTTKDLLPDTQLFSRGNQRQRQYQTPQTQAPKRKAKQLTRASKLPRAESTPKSKPALPRIARKSPSTSRANELDAALADLLQTKPARKPKLVAAKSLNLPPKPKATVTSKTFDLRKALLDDDESIASEAANAVEAALEAEIAAPIAKAAKPEPVENKVADPKIVEVPVEKQKPVEHAPAVVATKSAVEKAPTPVVQAAPEAKTIVAKPTGITPQVIAPVVEATPPKQVITIAQPRPQSRPSPTRAAVRSRPTVSDPFES
ncbi:MAG: hypothetical protein GXP24_09275, partial [Planctomycetes bacterium]|nr:hypothetical protein [Planctomycetota bacterium]